MFGFSKSQNSIGSNRSRALEGPASFYGGIADTSCSLQCRSDTWAIVAHAHTHTHRQDSVVQSTYIYRTSYLSDVISDGIPSTGHTKTTKSDHHGAEWVKSRSAVRPVCAYVLDGRTHPRASVSTVRVKCTLRHHRRRRRKRRQSNIVPSSVGDSFP